jgi:hypothetical protein
MLKSGPFLFIFKKKTNYIFKETGIVLEISPILIFIRLAEGSCDIDILLISNTQKEDQLPLLVMGIQVYASMDIRAIHSGSVNLQLNHPSCSLQEMTQTQDFSPFRSETL